MSLSKDVSEIKKLVEAKPVFKAASREEVAKRPNPFKTHRFKFDLWNLVDVNELNEHLDSLVGNEMPSDITYKFLRITPDGVVTVDATYVAE